MGGLLGSGEANPFIILLQFNPPMNQEHKYRTSNLIDILLTSILILSFHLRSGLSSIHFPRQEKVKLSLFLTN
jgi:hypothetical protein